MSTYEKAYKEALMIVLKERGEFLRPPPVSPFGFGGNEEALHACLVERYVSYLRQYPPLMSFGGVYEGGGGSHWSGCRYRYTDIGTSSKG